MPIRVLLVEDSQIASLILKSILNSSPDIEVVGEAGTGLEALLLIPQVQPDVICTDIHMPKMNGLTFTSEVMARYPRPILVISVSVQKEDTDYVFQLLNAGAVDVFPKPVAGLTKENERLKQELINKIKILSGVKVLTKRREYVYKVKDLETRNPAVFTTQFDSKPKIVVIGASTGGPQALKELFTQLPQNFPVPIICVQHIYVGFLRGLMSWLADNCRLSIQIAQVGDLPKPGKIYFPPEQRHLELDAEGRFISSNAPPVMGHRPSVTVTFKSVAQFYGKATVGVLLTGMGRDGAEGMHEIASFGGLTITQDEATCVVFGMPKEAINLGAVKQVLPIGAIAPMLLTLFEKQKRT